MRVSTFFYCLGQGFKNIRRNKLFSLASIATITACLFLFGLFASILLNFRHIMNTVEKSVSVTVFFVEGTTEDQILQRSVEIKEREGVADIVYVSAEEAWDSFKQDYLGDYADGFTENPLADSANLEIYLSDVSKQGELIDFLNTIPEVREVNYSAVTADTLSGANKLIAYISAAVVIILFLVSVFLINNTIAMGIQVRKEEISIMKYIGATDFFVRAPFVIEGILIGIAGSLVPMLLLYILYNRVILYVSGRFPSLATLMDFLPVNTVFATLVPVLLILGVGIGFMGSWVTVRKHLHV